MEGGIDNPSPDQVTQAVRRPHRTTWSEAGYTWKVTANSEGIDRCQPAEMVQVTDYVSARHDQFLSRKTLHGKIERNMEYKLLAEPSYVGKEAEVIRHMFKDVKRENRIKFLFDVGQRYDLFVLNAG